MAVRDALVGFMAATAQVHAEAIKAAQQAGIADTRAKEPAKYRGRKRGFTCERLNAMRDMLALGAGASAIAREAGLARHAVQRLRDDLGAAERLLAAWAPQHQR
jgi:putative DNA-invertase from lambdoid prophage Rac